MNDLTNVTNVKPSVFTTLVVVGSFISKLFGGWDRSLFILLLFMGIDVILGLVVASYFKNSNKSETGLVSSQSLSKGLIKKGTMLLYVLVAAQLDVLLDIDYARSGTIIAFTFNELVSMVEKGGLMGVNLPPAIINVMEVLQKNKDSYEDATDIHKE